jgi:L-ascorbate metabolism protein UlaG (beta-lactamase superfamily)
MRIEKIGHSCLLVETGDARLLIDPGNVAGAWDQLDGLTGILLTHQHPDHYDAQRFTALVQRNPDAQIVADEGTAPLLTGRGLSVTTVRDGDTVEVSGVSIGVRGRTHEVIHPDIPVIPNVGYVIGELFHPGDAFTPPPAGVRVLAAPMVAPWSKIAETVAYLRAAAVPVVVPVHDAVAAFPAMYQTIARGLLPDSTAIRALDGEGQVTF